jgi:hypothetical protein
LQLTRRTSTNNCEYRITNIEYRRIEEVIGYGPWARGERLEVRGKIQDYKKEGRRKEIEELTLTIRKMHD